MYTCKTNINGNVAATRGPFRQTRIRFNGLSFTRSMWVGLENASHFCANSRKCTTRNNELICIICRNNGENEARSRKRGRERNESTTTWKRAEEPSPRVVRPWKRLLYWGLWDLRWIRFSTDIITVPTLNEYALGFVAPKISLGFIER